MALFLIYNNDEAFLNDIENIPERVYSFIDMWCDNKPMPKISIISGCVAVDNTDNECYVEEFNTKEEALIWLGAEIKLEKDIEEDSLEMG